MVAVVGDAVGRGAVGGGFVLTVGIGTTDGVVGTRPERSGTADRPPSGMTNSPGREHTGPGAGMPTSGWPASAESMNDLKIGAADTPPKPAPPTFDFRLPNHTAVASWGVAPMNQASERLSVVPVLPKSVWLSSCAAVPVPPVTTPRSTFTSHEATAESIARSPG